MRARIVWMKWVLFGAALALLPAALSAQEGFDPMRVVYLQQAHPVLEVVMDSSGSMCGPINEPSSETYTSQSGNWSWGWEMSNPYGASSATISIYGDESVPSSGNDNFRTGQGEWVRACSMNGKLVSGSLSTVYVGGKWGWTSSTIALSSTASTYCVTTLHTLIDIWNVGADSGTYVLTSTPTQSTNLWTFSVRKVTGTVQKSGTWYLKVESNSSSFNHAFAAASTQVMMATATVTINQSTGTATYVHNPAQATWYMLPPSRMATMKNALGGSITLYSPKPSSLPAPANDSNSPAKQYYLLTDASGTGLAWGAQAGPWGGPFYDFAFDRILSTGGVAISTSPYNYGVAPDPAFTDAADPKDVVGATPYVDWGLAIFHGSCGGSDFESKVAPAANDDANVQQAKRTAIEPHLGPVYVGGVVTGIAPGDSTPTIDGITKGRGQLQTALSGDSTSCSRTYALLLTTDGVSNQCNPSGNEWSDCPTGSSTCSNCASYPPGASDTNWTTGIVKSGVTYPVRTYIIGVSPNVNRCELNWTAYKGRTDAYASDFGFTTANDVRLPPHSYDYTGANAGHNYAVFADSADDLQNGLQAILSTMGAGDYTTSPPVTAFGATGTMENFAYLGSAEFASLHGHLYAYDMTISGSHLNPTLYWDLGANLSYTMLGSNYYPVAPGTPGTTVANPAYTSSDARKIWTWNPQTSALVEVNYANAASGLLDTLAGFGTPTIGKTATVSIGGTPTVTYPIVDFIRGKYYWSSTLSFKERPWKLGPLLNATPAAIGPPENWTTPNPALPSHDSFTSDYAARHWLVYCGASDGLVHATDAVDGAEVFAMMLPNCLSSQPALFYNFINYIYGTPSNNGTDTGEPKTFDAHIYGVASSPRYSDIAFGTTYKTVMFLTEGGGGNDPNNAPPSAGDFLGWPAYLSAWGAWEWTASTAPRTALYVLDVTHPYPGRTTTTYTSSGDPTIRTWLADNNYDTITNHPFTPLGFVDTHSQDSSHVPLDIRQAWSMPAVAPVSGSQWACLMGSGFNPASQVSPGPLNQVSPTGFFFDPTSYTAGAMTVSGKTTLTYAATGVVGDQAFADAVLWPRTEEVFSSQFLSNEGVQADLNGHLWFLDYPLLPPSPPPASPPSWTVGVNVQPGNPIYYSPAASYWSFDAGDKWDIYGFSSGTFYERATAVTGGSICTGSNFCPRMYIVANNVAASPPTALPIVFNGTTNTANVWSTKLSGMAWTDSLGHGHTTTTGTQPVGSAFLLTSSSSSAPPLALFPLYDPYSGTCAGDSFVVTVTANPSASGGMAGGSATTTSVFHASAGVIGGMAVVSGKVIVSISGVGSGSRATVVEVPNINIHNPSVGTVPLSWIELK